jgi:hypothetical protein
MTQAISNQQIPDWLRITKIAEGHYRVTDTSVEAVGLYLGSFPTQNAAKRFALKVSEARAETRARNLRQMRSRPEMGSSMGL